MSVGGTNVPSGILDALITELGGQRGVLVGWGVAWARLIPTVLIVPAFGLALLPASLRAAMGLSLAVAIAPALRSAAVVGTLPWPELLAREALRGVPVALSAAIALWVAAVAGGVVDASGRATRFSSAGAPGAPFSTLFGLAAAIVFLGNGSAARLVGALSAAPPFAASALGRAALDLAAGIGIGASVGAPVLVAALAADVATSIVVRDRAGLSFDALFEPFRALVVLVATAALLDRMLEAAVLLAPGKP